MRFVSAEKDGRRFAGVVEGDRVVPLAGIEELGVETSLSRLRAAERVESETLPLDAVHLRPVVPRPGKVFCVGLNYRAHIEESGRSDSDYPVLFAKFASSLIGPYDEIALPPEAEQPDYEGEVVVVIGERGRRISREDAMKHVAGYAVANDVTMRDFQYRTHQWMQGKAWDASTPVGPALVTQDEVDIRDVGIRLRLNGEVMQESSTSLLIFDVPTLVSTISQFTSVEPGDLILTGTPGGVGHRRDPQVVLADGDAVSVEVDGIGEIRNTVRAEAL